MALNSKRLLLPESVQQRRSVRALERRRLQLYMPAELYRPAVLLHNRDCSAE